MTRYTPEIDAIQNSILNSFNAETYPRGLTMLCETLATLISHVSYTESDLLDGIDLAHKSIHKMATNHFVQTKRASS